MELVRSLRPITEIAQNAGYDNASKFSENFRKRYGATPLPVSGQGKGSVKAAIKHPKLKSDERGCLKMAKSPNRTMPFLM